MGFDLLGINYRKWAHTSSYSPSEDHASPQRQDLQCGGWRELLCESQEGIYGGVKHCSRIPLGISIPLSSGLGDSRLILCRDGWFFQTNITNFKWNFDRGLSDRNKSSDKCRVVGNEARVLSHFSRVWLCAIHGLQSARLLCPWNSPGKNTGVGCQFLLQEILLTQGLNLCFIKD